MNTLTLHQPWATLIALGVKRIETRSWPAPKTAIGQPLAIHAAAGIPAYLGLGRRGRVTIGGHEVERDAAGLLLRGPIAWPYRLPLGAVVASCTLTGCVPITEACKSDLSALVWPCLPQLWRYDEGSSDGIDIRDQLPYGDFRPGRWAWLLDDIKPTTARCPVCWGEGDIPIPDTRAYRPCPTCDGGPEPAPHAGRCEPIPATGHQRIWQWP